MRIITVFIIVFFSKLVAASPWIEKDDFMARHHIEVLTESGLLEVPAASWPMQWSQIASKLEELNSQRESISEQAKTSVKYLYSIYKLYNEGGSRYALEMSSSNANALTTSFVSSIKGKERLSLSYEYMDMDWAVRVSPNMVGGRHDSSGSSIVWDNSYAATKFGSWTYSVNTLEKWWGFGYADSLILNDNARPFPVLQISRDTSQKFESPYLSWIGYWNFTTFVGQLETNRFVEKPLIWGGRFEFSPSKYTDFALTRVAIFGGKGRPKDIGTFWDLLIGNDNCGNNDIDACGTGLSSNEPGNQLASVEARFKFSPLGLPLSLYTQLAFEDEAGGLPSRGIGLIGLTHSGNYQNIPYRLFIEHSNTISEDIYDESRFNFFYEHGIYRSGYRYYNRTIGSNYDNDSKVTSVGGWFAFTPDFKGSFMYKDGELNIDGKGARHSLISEKSAYNQYGVTTEYKHKNYGVFSLGIKKESLRQSGLSETILSLGWKREF
ncbi:MAG: capsule assembly Wzi family protein [Gammaproteobacteria bacterium]|nr:capsule assembly Wzi family protein [Gammaproteobacteria bacterium]